MPHVDESVGEMGRALDELHMAGVAMNTTVLGRALVEPDYEPVFAELNRRGAVLYLHPAGNGACSPLISNYQLTWMVGAPVEDTISIMQLITTASRPAIRISRSYSHLGEALPMLLHGPTTSTAGRTGHPGAAQRGRVRTWYDTVGHGTSPPCGCDRHLRRGLPPPRNRLPLRKQGHLRPRGRIPDINDPQIGTTAARAILDQNASALLGIG